MDSDSHQCSDHHLDIHQWDICSDFHLVTHLFRLESHHADHVDLDLVDHGELVDLVDLDLSDHA